MNASSLPIPSILLVLQVHQVQAVPNKKQIKAEISLLEKNGKLPQATECHYQSQVIRKIFVNVWVHHLQTLCCKLTDKSCVRIYNSLLLRCLAGHAQKLHCAKWSVIHDRKKRIKLI